MTLFCECWCINCLVCNIDTNNMQYNIWQCNFWHSNHSSLCNLRTMNNKKKKKDINFTASFLVSNLLQEYISYNKVFNKLHIFCFSMQYYIITGNEIETRCTSLLTDRYHKIWNPHIVYQSTNWQKEIRRGWNSQTFFYLSLHSLSNYYHWCVNEYRCKRSRIHHAPSISLRETAPFRHISLSSR